MINQDLQTLINESKIGEAIKYIEEKCLLKDFEVQLLRVRLLKQINWKKDALKLASRDIFLNDPNIQYERVLSLKEYAKFETAISICDKFIDIEKFLLEKIELLCITKDFGTAYKICSDEKYKDNEKIQKQKYTIFKKIENMVHVYDKHPDNMDMQYNKAKLLRKAGLYNELMLTCNKYYNDEKITFQKIEMLKEKGLYEKALELINDEIYKDMAYIQSQKINILIHLNRYEEALSVTNEPKFINLAPIQSQKVAILANLGMYEEALKTYEEGLKIPDFSINYELLRKIRDEVYKNNDKSDVLTEYLTRLYSNKIDIEMIDKADLTEFQKTILKIGYYEKFSKKQGIYYIKQVRFNFKDKEYKVLNQLLALLSSKKNNIFKINTYEEILNSRAKLSMIDKLSYESKTEVIETKNEEKIISKVEVCKEPKKMVETKYKVCIGNKVSNVHETSSKNNDVKIKTSTDILVKDVLKEETEEVLKYIYGTLFYVSTDYVSKAMKAFDIFEAMIYKEASKENIEKVLNLFEKPAFKRRFNFDIKDAKIKKYVK